MSEDMQAGRLHVDAYIDTTGATRGLQRRLDAQTKGIRAKIRAEIDTRGLVTSARKAAGEASSAARIKIKAEVDTRGLVAQVKAAALEASRAAKVSLKVNVDKRSLAAAKAEVAAVSGGRGSNLKVNVDADTTGAKAETEAFRAAESTRPVSIPVTADTSPFVSAFTGIGDVLSKFSAIPAIVGGVYTLGAAVVQLGSGLFAVAAAASQAVPILAAIPNIAAAAVQGIGSLFLGLSGVGAAVKALGQKQQTGAKDARTYAKAQTDAANAVSDAKYALRQAIHQEADDRRTNAHAIKEAAYAEKQANLAVRDAYKGLHDARVQARADIKKLAAEAKQAALDELSANDALVNAKQHLQDVQWDAASSDQERRAAKLQVDQAAAAANDAHDHAVQSKKDSREASAKGVKGADVVVQAQQQLSSALHSQQEAVYSLKQAKHSAADQEQADAHAIAMARRSLADAHKGVAIAAANEGAATVALANAYQHLSPAAITFAKFVQNTLLPRFYRLRNAVAEALLPPLQKGVVAAMPLLDTLQTGLVRSGTIMGHMALRLGQLFGRKTFNNQISKIMASNNRALRNFGFAGLSLVKILTRIAVAAGPHLVEPFARWVRTLTAGWSATLKTQKGQKRLADFFDRAAHRAANLGHIIWNLVGALVGVGKAASPSGGSLLGGFEKETKKWDKWANSPSGQKKMKDFFKAVKPVTTQVGLLVEKLFKFLALAGGSDTAPVMTFFKTLNKIMAGINKLMAMPGVGPVVGQVMALAGVGGALGFVAGKILTLAGGLGKVAKVTGLGKVAKSLNAIGATTDEKGNVVKGTSLVSRATKRIGRGINEIGVARDAEGTIVADTTLGGRAKRGVKAVGRGAKRGVKAAGRGARRGAAAVGRGAARGGRAVGRAAGRGASRVGGLAADAGVAVAGKAKDLGKKGIEATTRAWGRFATAAGKARTAVADGARALGTWLVAAGKQIVLLGRQALLWTAQRAKIVAVKAAQLAMAAAQKIAAAAQWLLNAAMDANPIALIIIAIAALIGIFILLYKKNATVRRVIQACWAGIKNAISWAWHKVIKPALHAFKTEMQILGRVVGWLWTHIVKPYFRLLAAAIKFYWQHWISPVLKAMKWYIDHVLGPVIVWLWKKVIKPLWNSIGTLIKWVWNHVIKPAFEGLKTGLSLVKNAFSSAVTSIKNAWDKIRAAVKKPINAVIGIINSGIIDKFDWLSNKLGGPHINELHKLAEGSWVPGRSPHSRADNIPILATAKEFMVRQRSALNMKKRFPGALEWINKHGSLPGYAKGGSISGVAMNAVASGLGGLLGYQKRKMKHPGLYEQSDQGRGRYNAGGVIKFAFDRSITGPLQRLAAGGTIANRVPGAQRWAKSQVGKPYQWGAVGPGGYDCSGFMSAITNYLRGSGIHHRVGATGSFPWAGFKPGPGLFTIGSSPNYRGDGTGHMAGTLGGLNVESHAGAGVVVGKAARSYRDSGFTRVAHLGPGGGGGGILGGALGIIKHIPSFLEHLGSKVAGIVKKPLAWFQNAIKNKVSGMTSKFGQSEMAKMAAGMPRKLIGSAAAKITSIFHGRQDAYNKKHPNAGSNISVGGGFPGANVGGLKGHASPASAMAYAKKIMPKGWKWDALKTLWMGESGWRWNADNPGSTAYGIPQALPGSKMGKGWHDDAGHQIRWGLRYIANRYNTSQHALSLWRGRSPHWYDGGGALYPGSTLAINKTGKTETVFTNDNMVNLGGALASAARSLHSLLSTGEGGTVNAPLVGELTLIGRDDERRAQLDDVTHHLKVIRAGGVYAKRSP